MKTIFAIICAFMFYVSTSIAGSIDTLIAKKVEKDTILKIYHEVENIDSWLVDTLEKRLYDIDWFQISSTKKNVDDLRFDFVERITESKEYYYIEYTSNGRGTSMHIMLLSKIQRRVLADICSFDERELYEFEYKKNNEIEIINIKRKVLAESISSGHLWCEW